MAQKIKIIAQNLPAGFGFLIGDRNVKLDENISLEDAKLIASQHAGYIEIIDVTDMPTVTEVVQKNEEPAPQEPDSEGAKNTKKK